MRAVGVLGSLAVHFGVLSYFLLAPQPQAQPVDRKGNAQSGDLVMVSVAPHVQDVTGSHNSQHLSRPTERDAFGLRHTRIHHLAALMHTPGDQAPADDVSVQNGSGDESAKAAAPAASVSFTALGSDYQRRLEDHIAQFQQRGPQGQVGVVYLQILLDRAGAVQGIWVTKSSGSTALDEEAVETVRRAAPMLPVPSELPDPLMISLPLRWSLAPLYVERAP